MATGKPNTYAARRRFKGKMVVRVGRPNKSIGVPRSHAGATRPGDAGFECGQDEPYGSAHIPGKYKVQLPRNYIRYSIPVHSTSRGATP